MKTEPGLEGLSLDSWYVAFSLKSGDSLRRGWDRWPVKLEKPGEEAKEAQCENSWP